jgi:nucleoside-diphosphate-sugar epimerase
MNVLLLGGTGLISVGIIKHLLKRDDCQITCFNRGQSEAKDDAPLPESVEQVHGDRNDIKAMLAAFDGRRFDVVIDMIAFNTAQVNATADLTRQVGAKHLLFCSTVCTYGVKIPPGVIVDESFPQEPINDYGRNKLEAERTLLEIDRRGDFATTIIRPSHTYGEGGPLIDNLEFDPPTWSRIREGLPVVIAGDGLALWNSTHRDDVGKLFAHAAGREITFGKSYNATTQRVFTWRDYYREAAGHFGKPAPVLFLPRDMIVAADPPRFGLLREITGFHGAYTSAAAMRDVPEFRCEVGFADGASRTLAHLDRKGRLKSADDDLIDKLVRRARDLGLEPVEA